MRRAIRQPADGSKPTKLLVGAGPNEGGARIVATRSSRERLALLGTEGIAQNMNKIIGQAMGILPLNYRWLTFKKVHFLEYEK